MFNTQFDQTENCNYVTEIINYLNSTSKFSLNDFKELLDRVGDSKTSTATNNSRIVRPTNSTPISQQNSQPINPIPSGAVQPRPIRSVSNMQLKEIPQVNMQKETDKKDEISFFYLMQHYNSDNAAQYKKQKAAKKAIKQELKAQKKSNKTTNNNKKKNENVHQPTFIVPGAQPMQNSQPVQNIQPMQNSQPMQSSQPMQRAPMVSAMDAAPPKQSGIHFGETTVLNGGINNGETTVLDNSKLYNSSQMPFLLREKTSEKIPLDKPIYRIGKERSYVDYFIGDNTSISRSHASFITRDGEYFVVDTNSTNHTFVNGEMLCSNTEKKIENGSIVRLANEVFEFKLQ
ncbi:MAG: FHA domain-containing protein [Suipraeoptans sp.]